MEERGESERGRREIVTRQTQPTPVHIAFTMCDTESDQRWGRLGLACKTRRESEMGGEKMRGGREGRDKTASYIETVA